MFFGYVGKEKRRDYPNQRQSCRTYGSTTRPIKGSGKELDPLIHQDPFRKYTESGTWVET